MSKRFNYRIRKNLLSNIQIVEKKKSTILKNPKKSTQRSTKKIVQKFGFMKYFTRSTLKKVF